MFFKIRSSPKIILVGMSYFKNVYYILSKTNFIDILILLNDNVD